MDTSSPKALTNTKHKTNTSQGHHQGVLTRLPSKQLVSLLHTTSPSNSTPTSSSSNSPHTHLCFSLSSNSNSSSSSSVVRMSSMGCKNRARAMKISSKSRLKIISRVLTLSTQGCHWKRLRMARSKEEEEPKVPLASRPKQSHLIIIIMLIQSLRNQEGIVIKDRLTSLSKTSSRTSQAIPRQDQVSTRRRTLAVSSRFQTALS